MKRALVLGGGGVIGVAWETGLLKGLAQGGIDVRSADVVIGTSAGSMVGTRVAAGHDIGEPAPRPVGVGGIPLPEGGLDGTSLTRVFAIWSQVEVMTEETCAKIGALASAARTAEPAKWIASTGGSTGVEDWPATELRLTAVDVKTGKFEVHSRLTGAPLAAAVASSCAVPGMFPPIEIGGRCYMDGGVRSGTSADVALDIEPDVVFVIAPICDAIAGIGPWAQRCMDDEVAQLRAAGSRVCAIVPEEKELEAFGGDLMDPGRVGPTREVALERGLALAKGEARVWLD